VHLQSHSPELFLGGGREKLGLAGGAPPNPRDDCRDGGPQTRGVSAGPPPLDAEGRAPALVNPEGPIGMGSAAGAKRVVRGCGGALWLGYGEDCLHVGRTSSGGQFLRGFLAGGACNGC